MLQFRGSTITSDAGLLPYRELDDVLGLTDAGADTLADARTGKNGRHRLAGLLRQSVFGRLAGYKDVNDADRLCRDPTMRWVVGDQAITGYAASASQMGRFETKWLSRPENLAALGDLQANQPVYRLGAAGRLFLTDCCGRHAPFTVVETPNRAILAANRPESGEYQLMPLRDVIE